MSEIVYDNVFVDTVYKIYDAETDRYIQGRRSIVTEEVRVVKWKWYWTDRSDGWNEKNYKSGFSSEVLYLIQEILGGGEGINEYEQRMIQRDKITYLNLTKILLMLHVVFFDDGTGHCLEKEASNIWFVPVDGMGRSIRLDSMGPVYVFSV